MKPVSRAFLFCLFVLLPFSTVVAQTLPKIYVCVEKGHQGPAAYLAQEQIKTWKLKEGGIASEEQLDLSAPGPVSEKLSKTGCVIFLREDFDSHADIPSSEGHLIQSSGLSKAQLKAIYVAIQRLNSLGPKPKADWQHKAFEANVPKEYTDLVKHRIPIIQITTSTKHQKKNRIHQRAREHRHAVHAFLKAGNYFAENTSPDQMIPKRGTHNRKPISIAIFNGPGAVSSSGHGPAWIKESLRGESDFMLTLIGPEEIRAGALPQFDAVLFGGGLSSTQAKSLHQSGRDKVREFIQQGGGYVGICAGAFLASCNKDYSLKILNAKMKSGSGTAIVQLGFTPEGTELLQTEGEHATKFSGGPGNAKPAHVKNLPAFEIIATFKTNAPKTKFAGAPAIIAGDFGAGKVITFSPHCERLPGPRQSFIEALRTVSRHGKQGNRG